MNLSPYCLDSLYRCTKADWDLFKSATDFLPRRTDEPYHSGPHNLQRFRMVYELVRPKTVLEIGFNLGHSAVMWLMLGAKYVASIEVRDDAKVRKAAAAIITRYPERHMLYFGSDEATFNIGEFDLIFIDGSHDKEFVMRDINHALELRCPYILMDDYDWHHGPGVVQAVEECGLIPVAIFGTMALCRPPTQFTKRADPLGANYYE